MTKILIVILVIAGVIWLAAADRDVTKTADTAGQTTASTSLDTRPAADVDANESTTVPVPATGEYVTIDLSGQSLISTPKYIFDRTSTQQLDLSHNNLSGSLPAEIRQLQDLRVLNLSNNNFTGVPAEIGQLQKLEVLDLSDNNLTGLPYELGNLSNLRTLDLTGNNYATQDLDVIRKSLPSTVVIEVD
jgi:Leucine-rich repeat (LRR) protein